MAMVAPHVPVPISDSSSLSLRSSFLTPPRAFCFPASLSLLPPTSPCLKIENAISRKKKEETVDKVRLQLEDSYLVAGIQFGGLTVKQMQDLRKRLPDTVKLCVAKNKLVEKAITGTKWEALRPCLKGMNAWLFVHTEEIPAALKPYRGMQKELKLEKNDFTGAVFEGKYFAPEDFKILETMPSRADIYAKLLGSLQSPASGLVSVLQGPSRELVMTLKAYVAKLEEQTGASSSP